MIAAALAVFFAALATYSLLAGRTATTWPAPKMTRADDPISFWFFVGFHILAGLVAAVIALVTLL